MHGFSNTKDLWFDVANDIGFGVIGRHIVVVNALYFFPEKAADDLQFFNAAPGQNPCQAIHQQEIHAGIQHIGNGNQSIHAGHTQAPFQIAVIGGGYVDLQRNLLLRFAKMLTAGADAIAQGCIIDHDWFLLSFV